LGDSNRLKCEGIKLGRGTIEGLEDYNKVTFYRSCLRNPGVAGKGFQVCGFSVYPRVLAFIIVWILTPPGHNHAVLHEEDLILMNCLMNQIKVNWPSVIGMQLEKAKRLMDYRIPYVVLISKFIQHFKVPDEGELVEPVKQAFEMNTTNFNKMGLTKINGQWKFPTSEDEEIEESSEPADDADSGAPTKKQKAEGGADEGAVNTPIDVEDDNIGETGKPSDFSKAAQEIMEKLEAISAEQRTIKKPIRIDLTTWSNRLKLCWTNWRPWLPGMNHLTNHAYRHSSPI